MRASGSRSTTMLAVRTRLSATASGHDAASRRLVYSATKIAWLDGAASVVRSSGMVAPPHKRGRQFDHRAIIDRALDGLFRAQPFLRGDFGGQFVELALDAAAGAAGLIGQGRDRRCDFVFEVTQSSGDFRVDQPRDFALLGNSVAVSRLCGGACPSDALPHGSDFG